MQKDTSHNRNQILQDKLDRAVRLNRMYQSEDFREVLLPALKEASNLKFLNPLDFPSQEEFLRAYNLAFSKAKAYSELLSLFETADEQIRKIKLELALPEKSWKTGE